MDKLRIYEELKDGGAWLAAARSWMQSNIRRGDTICWNSGELVSIPFCNLEQFARHVAIAAVAEDRLQELLAKHSELLEENPYCYFELAYTRQTEWMVWICSKPREDDPNRKVIAQGQGSTPDEAAWQALDGMTANVE